MAYSYVDEDEDNSNVSYFVEDNSNDRIYLY